MKKIRLEANSYVESHSEVTWELGTVTARLMSHHARDRATTMSRKRLGTYGEPERACEGDITWFPSVYCCVDSEFVIERAPI